MMDYATAALLQFTIVWAHGHGRTGDHRILPGVVIENAGVAHLADEKIEVIIKLDSSKAVQDTLA